jgi:hypothetical protein
MSVGFFCKFGEQEGWTGPTGVCDDIVGVEMMWWKAVREWIWCKYYVHMHVNGKIRPAETIPEIQGRADGKEWWRCWI